MLLEINIARTFLLSKYEQKFNRVDSFKSPNKHRSGRYFAEEKSIAKASVFCADSRENPI